MSRQRVFVGRRFVDLDGRRFPRCVEVVEVVEGSCVRPYRVRVRRRDNETGKLVGKQTQISVQRLLDDCRFWPRR